MEWMNLRSSGLVDHLEQEEGDGSRQELIRVIQNLFASLRNLLQQHKLLNALDHLPCDDAVALEEGLIQAEDMCTGTTAFLDDVTALGLLRRKLRAAHLDLRDEQAVLAQLESIVALIALTLEGLFCCKKKK